MGEGRVPHPNLPRVGVVVPNPNLAGAPHPLPSRPARGGDTPSFSDSALFPDSGPGQDGVPYCSPLARSRWSTPWLCQDEEHSTPARTGWVLPSPSQDRTAEQALATQQVGWYAFCVHTRGLYCLHMHLPLCHWVWVTSWEQQ